MLRQPKGWALDCQSLEDAEAKGARKVEIEDTESGLTYSASVALIRSKGVAIDRKFGFQIALPLHYWTVNETGGIRQLELMSC